MERDSIVIDPSCGVTALCIGDGLTAVAIERPL
jgi:hypothetical protein